MMLPRLQIQIPALILPSSRNKDDKNDESSNANNNDPEEYNYISELVDDIKNGNVDTDEISQCFPGFRCISRSK